MKVWGKCEVEDESQCLQEDQFQHNCTVRVKRLESVSWQLLGLMTVAEFTTFVRLSYSTDDNPFDPRTVV